MERATQDQFSSSALRNEHFHRYALASRLARGLVVDCACGIGYGSEMLCGQEAVDSYWGIDPSDDAIDYARANYARPKVEFSIGTLEENPCLESSVDIFLMFETLEHTVDPDAVLRSVRRCIKPNGLLIGSVPSAEYEALCDQTYGKNPFHLQRFSKEELEAVLSRHFDSYQMLSAEFVLGTLFRNLMPANDDASSPAAAARIIVPTDHGNAIAGSLLFIAGATPHVDAAMRDLAVSTNFMMGMPKVMHDQEEVEPIRQAFHLAEAAVVERDKAITAQAAMLEERWTAMQSMEATLRQRQTSLAVMSQVNTTLGGIAKTALLMTDPESFLTGLSQSHGNIPFLDMALSHYLFTDRLYRAARAHGGQDLFFFAREGQMLKEMFDFYQTLRGGANPIRTHYLKVSRRSTFLLSLGPLIEEKFDVLFRQYHRISIIDFLKSLDLDEYAPLFASALGVDFATFGVVSDNLPTDSRFKRLLQLKLFQQTYEVQRTARSTAFGCYLSSLLGGSVLPDMLHVVDVG